MGMGPQIGRVPFRLDFAWFKLAQAAFLVGSRVQRMRVGPPRWPSRGPPAMPARYTCRLKRFLALPAGPTFPAGPPPSGRTPRSGRTPPLRSDAPYLPDLIRLAASPSGRTCPPAGPPSGRPPQDTWLSACSRWRFDTGVVPTLRRTSKARKGAYRYRGGGCGKPKLSGT